MLLFFINDSSVVFYNNPFPSFLTNDCFFAKRDYALDSFKYLFRHYNTAFISFLHPFKMMTGVSVLAGLNPP